MTYTANETPENQERWAAYRKAAKAQWEEEGEIEIDDGALVSEGDESGAYVAAWVWVNKLDAGICAECGKTLSDGEGYDGLCGSCADKAEGGNNGGRD
jgi:hypothetical protein